MYGGLAQICGSFECPFIEDCWSLVGETSLYIYIYIVSTHMFFICLCVYKKPIQKGLQLRSAWINPYPGFCDVCPALLEQKSRGNSPERTSAHKDLPEPKEVCRIIAFFLRCC